MNQEETEHNVKSPRAGMSRRGFLRGTGSVAALAVLSSMLCDIPVLSVMDAANAGSAAKADGWYPSVCKMCMQADCITRVHVVDGIVVKIEGDERSPNNAGRMCPRGNSAIMGLYNPWRIKAPMKRTNPEKGLDVDPGWVEISWDEALNTVAGQLKKYAADDPRKIIMTTGMGQIMLEHWGTRPLAEALGTPNVVTSRGQHCAYHFWGNYVHRGMPDVAADMDHCEYMLNIGKSQGPNVCIASSGSKAVIDTLERGCKLVTVDPRCSQEASKGDWIPILPGTDLAFVLGVLHTILYEIDKYDEWFVKTRTNAPYLIAPDGDYLRDPVSNKPLQWDLVAGQAVAFDEIEAMNSALFGTYNVNGVKTSPGFQQIKDTVKSYTPEWAEQECSVPAITIRKVANDLVSHAKIGSTIDIDGFTFPFRPISINVQSGGYQHTGCGPRTDMVVKIILELLGAVEVPGGVNGNHAPDERTFDLDADGVLRPEIEAKAYPWEWPPNKIDANIFYPVSHSRTSIVAKAILNPDEYHIPYQAEMLFNGGGNIVRAYFNRDLWVEAFKKLKFISGTYLTYDDNAMLSDVLLPDEFFLERDFFEPGIRPPHKVMVAESRSLDVFDHRDSSAIKRVYNAKDAFTVMCELAERTGVMTGPEGFVAKIAHGERLPDLDTSKPMTLKRAAEEVLKYRFGKKYSLDKLSDEVGPIFKYAYSDKVCKENYSYYFFPENKVRHPMYMMVLRDIGNNLKTNLASVNLDKVPGWEDMTLFWAAFNPLPKYIASPQLSADKEYDMFIINYKTQGFPFYTGDTLGNPWLNEVIGGLDPYEFNVLMNTETAKRKGLKTGDAIVIESPHGKTTGTLKATQLVHPRTLAIGGVHGLGTSMSDPLVARGTSVSPISSMEEKDLTIDPVTGGLERSPAVKIYKA